MKNMAMCCLIFLSSLILSEAGRGGDSILRLSLSDISRPGEAARWSANAAKMTEAEVAGSKCLQATLPVYAPGGEEKIAVILSQGLAVSDWSGFEAVEVELGLDGGQPVSLYAATVTPGKKLWVADFLAKPGRHIYRLELGEPATSKPVTAFALGKYQPDTEVAFQVFRVTLAGRSFASALAQLAASARARAEKAATEDGKNSFSAFAAEVDATEQNLGGELEAEKARLLINSISAARAKLAVLTLADEKEKLALLAGEKSLTWGWATGADRVFRDQLFPGTLGGTGRISLAGGEAEGAQLALFAVKAGEQVSASVTALVSSDGNSIPTENVSAVPVGYVFTKPTPEYEAAWTGWTPDPLLPYLKGFSIEAGMWQSVWLDVSVPRGQVPGVYRGTVIVAVAGAEELRLPFEVKVWGFDLPTEAHLPLAISSNQKNSELKDLYADGNAEALAEAAAYLRGEKERGSLSEPAEKIARVGEATVELLRAHRVNETEIYRASILPLAKLEEMAARDSGPICLYSVGKKIDKTTGLYPKAEAEKILAALGQVVPELRKKGLIKRFYVYGFDEVTKDGFKVMQDIFSQIKAKYPDLLTLTTAYDYSFGAKTGVDAIDAWCPLTPKYMLHQAEIAAARARGKQVWWYVCCGPHPPAANFLIHAPLTGTRLVVGFMPWKFKADGFLYYAASRWRTYPETPAGEKPVAQKDKKEAPFQLLKGGTLTNQSGKGYHDYYGDGFLLYPAEDGPVATIRLKNIRDGLEDYEYLWLLRQRLEAARAGRLANLPEGWAKRAEAALAVSDDLCKDATNAYARSGAAIVSAREEIGDLLQAAGK